jgi:hypothetical protein
LLELAGGVAGFVSIATFPEVSEAAISPEAQLNLPGFSSCLIRHGNGPEDARFDWRGMRGHYGFSGSDGYLTYLSVYPNRRVPVLEQLKQERAHERWQIAFEAAEERLVSQLFLASDAPLLPGPVFGLAIDSCREAGLALPESDPFCATLILHNSFRTMGRHRQAIHGSRDLNPHWFRANPEFWKQVFPEIREQLIPLRRDGGGDRFGEWYHLFGILSFSLHEGAFRGDLWLSELAANANRILNPLLAGGTLPPDKARLDLDTVELAKEWFFRPTAPGTEEECLRRDTYVNGS